MFAKMQLVVLIAKMDWELQRKANPRGQVQFYLFGATHRSIRNLYKR